MLSLLETQGQIVGNNRTKISQGKSGLGKFTRHARRADGASKIWSRIIL